MDARRASGAFAVNGSQVECPRTAANEEALGCAGRTKTGPQLFVTTLWHMGTGLPWDFRIGPGTASERRHLEEMLADLPADALAVADPGSPATTSRRITASGRAFLLRVGADVPLLGQLGCWERENADTVYLWPDNQHSRPPLVLRLIVLGRGKRRMYLVTNVLDGEGVAAESGGVTLWDALGRGSVLSHDEADAPEAEDAQSHAGSGPVRIDMGAAGGLVVRADQRVGHPGSGRRSVKLVGRVRTSAGAGGHATGAARRAVSAKPGRAPGGCREGYLHAGR